MTSALYFWKTKEPTFQKAHSTVETFWAKFIVAKGTQKLADQDIGRFRDIDESHVPKQELDSGFP